jgi:hypothetical protein
MNSDFNMVLRGKEEAARSAMDQAQNMTDSVTSSMTISGGMIALYVVSGVMLLYSAFSLGMTVYNYYHPDYTDVPLALVDVTDTVDGDRYIKYDVVYNAETNEDGVYEAGDLNAFEGKRWNALYYTKNYEAGKPLLADGFTVSNNNNKPAEGFTPVHRFGEVVCYNLNKYNFDGDTQIYLSVKQSKNDKSAVADVPEVVGSMFGAGNLPFWSSQTTYYLLNYAVLLVVAFLGATPISKSVALKISETKVGGRVMNVLEPIAVAVVLLLCVATLVNDSFTPFLYFQF